MPPPIEERVAYLEGKVDDHSRGFGEIRDQVTNVDGHVLALDQKVDGFRTELASRIDGVVFVSILSIKRSIGSVKNWHPASTPWISASAAWTKRSIGSVKNWHPASTPWTVRSPVSLSG